MLQNLSFDDIKIKRNWLISFFLSAFLQMLLPTYAFIFYSSGSLIYAITNASSLDITSIAFLTLTPTIYLLQCLLIWSIYYFSYKKRGTIILSLSMILAAYLTFSTAFSTILSLTPFIPYLKYHLINLAITSANIWFIITSAKFWKANRKFKLNLNKI